MKIVVDTSVIIAVIGNEPERKQIIALTEGFELISPQSVYWEIGNAFSAMFKKGIIDLEKAKTVLTMFRKIAIRFVDIELEESLELAKKLNIYCYDAYLLRCVQKYYAPLITLDKKLQKSAKLLGLKTIEVN